MVLLPSQDEIEAGAEALEELERRRFFEGPSSFDRSTAVIAAVTPLIRARLEAEVQEAATIMIAAITITQGGRLAVPNNVYEAAKGTELLRYDDMTTQSIVFETPAQDVA